MNRTHVLVSIIILTFLCSLTVYSSVPGVTRYSLKMQLFLKEQALTADAGVTVKNSSGIPVTELPFALYRLLEVESVSDDLGNPLRFTQDIVPFSDERTLQVNAISVRLLAPLEPNQSTTIHIRYKGSIFGYPEVMAYVRDRINEDYSLIRPDALAYPMLCLPSFQNFLSAQDSYFTYYCEVSVPKGYTVTCGGALKKTEVRNDTTTFIYESKIPTWRIDIAVAKFTTLQDEPHKLYVYVLPADSVGAVRVLRGMREVIELYTKLFGAVGNYQGYTAIEIPDGWGSQASDYYFLQTSAAFRDSTRLSEVYHEIAHTWNVKAKEEVSRCRYFDEAFGSYFAALAIKHLEGNDAFLSHLEHSREIFVRWATYDKKYSETPIAEYGKRELGRMSYTKGAWSLYVLHQLMGDAAFNSMIQEFLSRFSEGGADFKDFQSFTKQLSNRNVDKFFDEWIYGTESSRLLLENVSIDEIVKRYQ